MPSPFRTFNLNVAGGLGIFSGGVLLWVLYHGPTPAQIGAGSLLTARGATVTDTRASNKTCNTNADGSTVVTLSSNQPCVDTVGLNVEGGATNLALNSQAFTAAAWVTSAGATTTDNAATAPDGTATAAHVTTSGASQTIRQTVAVSAGTAYTFSFYARNNGGAVAAYSVFDVTHGADIVATTSYFSQLTSTWKRVTVGFTTPAGCTSINVYVIRDAGNGGDLYFWGAQVETGSFATSYIATAGTTATRAADGPDYQSALATGHTPSFAADVTLAVSSGGIQFALEAWNSGTDRWDIYITGANTLRCEFFNGSAFDGDSIATVTAGVKTHVSCSYDGVNIKACVAGACTNTAKTFTPSASYAKTGIGVDENLFGTGLLQGQISNICVAATPAGCN